MKIASRPTSTAGSVSLPGGQAALTSDQLELITSLLCHTRLGLWGPGKVASDALMLIEQAMGRDFVDHSTSSYPVEVTIEDRASNVLVSTKGDPDLSIIIEIQ